ncbi:MAG TPA: methyltransferase domain-containing protein [Gemmatimonadales bacterium]|nr:methyltransferase domain-containing protein [Gemmatimonadales bacterium]
MTTAYAIRGGEEGARRLDLLAQVMAPTTEAFLGSAGIAAGMVCLDIGCGAGHVSRRLAALVGPAGKVVGLDLDPVKLATARAEAERAGLENIEHRVADATAWSEPGRFDVVYGRFIVSHLAGRQGFIAQLRDALRPSGTLVLEDIDFSGAFCYPANAAYSRYCELYVQVIARRGGDANVGAKLYQLCLDAGLEDVHVGMVQPMHCRCTPEKSLSLSTMINIADAVLAEGLAGEEEVRETIAELRAFTEDPRSTIACPRIFQVRGRKPAHRH